MDDVKETTEDFTQAGIFEPEKAEEAKPEEETKPEEIKEAIAPEEQVEPEEKSEDNSTHADSDPDKLTISNQEALVEWTDKEGETHSRKFAELVGGTRFKDEHDKWIETERKPLEEATAMYNEWIDDLEVDPHGFLLASAKNAVTDHSLDLGQFALAMVREAKNRGLLKNVDLTNADTGEETTLPDEQSDTRRNESTVRERRLLKERNQSSAKVFELEHRAMKAEVLSLPQYKGVFTPEMIRSADTFYKESPEFFEKKNKEAPYEAALLFARTDIELNKSSEKSTDAAETKPKAPRRKTPIGSKQAAENSADEEYQKAKIY